MRLAKLRRFWYPYELAVYDPGTDFMFVVEVFQDPLERAIVNTLWQVGLSTLMVHHVPLPAGPAADPLETGAPPDLAGTEAPSGPPPRFGADFVPRGPGDGEPSPPPAAAHAAQSGWTRRCPKAKVMLYDGAGLLPVLLGEVGADSWVAATRAVREARGQHVVMVPLSVTIPSRDPRALLPLTRHESRSESTTALLPPPQLPPLPLSPSPRRAAARGGNHTNTAEMSWQGRLHVSGTQLEPSRATHAPPLYASEAEALEVLRRLYDDLVAEHALVPTRLGTPTKQLMAASATQAVRGGAAALATAAAAGAPEPSIWANNDFWGGSPALRKAEAPPAPLSPPPPPAEGAGPVSLLRRAGSVPPARPRRSSFEGKAPLRASFEEVPLRASFGGAEHTISPPRLADVRADAERAPLRVHAPRPARALVSVDIQPPSLPDPSSLLPLPSPLGSRSSLSPGIASPSPALQGPHTHGPGEKATPLDAPRARPVRAAVDYAIDQRGPVRAFSAGHLQREAFSPISPTGEIGEMDPPLQLGHKTVFIGDSAEDMLRRAAAAAGGPLDNAEWFTRHSGVGGSPSALGGSPSRARPEEYGPYSLQASVFAPHSAFAQHPTSHQLRHSKSSGDIAYRLSLGTNPLLAGRSPNPMLESTGLSRPPAAYGKRAKLPKLEWQPPAPQAGSIDPLSVVDWSTASAAPSKVEFALGPPVLRPSEPEPEASWLAQARNVSLSPNKCRDLAQPVNFS